uniref:Uncharacterized protein n=1 Tax=Arundo donax TaxID=35708 RepID=A0A0A9BGE3_ARUDO
MPSPNLALAQTDPAFTLPSFSIPRNSHDRVVCSRCPRFGNTETTLGCFEISAASSSSSVAAKPLMYRVYE